MEVEILIVDNDPVVCYLTQELLQDIGFTTLIVQDSRRVIQTVKELKPRAVILDILMPGIDGLTLCRAIKSDPATKETKVVIASAKAFAVEKERAQRFGAELFLNKPYDIKNFAKQIIQVVGQPIAPAKPTLGGARNTMHVRVWGSRPLPVGGGRLSDGQQSPCVSVETSDRLFVFDAGSGIVQLGEELLAEGRHKEVWLFLTHFHPSHVEGLGRFGPARSPGITLHLGGPTDPDKALDAAIRETFQQSFSADPRPIAAKMQLYVFHEGDYDLLPGVRVSTFYTNHPTTTLGYRLDYSGRSVVYCPASELVGESGTALQDYDEALGRRVRRADLLIHDARFREEDYASHKNEGHSSFTDAIDFASEHEVEQALMFGLDPSYSDTDLENLALKGKEHLESKSASLRFQIAKEGMKISL